LAIFRPFDRPRRATRRRTPRAFHMSCPARGVLMPAALPLKHPVKVGQLVRRRLRELKRTPRELADAVQVSEDYIVDIVAGRRRPPAPGRIDLYAPMARFLRLHRNDLPTCARVERSAEPAARRRPDPGVWKLLVELCEPKKARLLARQLAKPEGGGLGAPIGGRLVRVAPGFWNRRAGDEGGMGVAVTGGVDVLGEVVEAEEEAPPGPPAG